MKKFISSALLCLLLVISITSSAFAMGDISQAANSIDQTQQSSTESTLASAPLQEMLPSQYQEDGVLLQRDANGNFSATVPLVSPDNSFTTQSVFGGLTMSLHNYVGTEMYELFYTMVATGDWLKGLKGNFTVQNTSAISPSLFFNEDVNDKFVATRGITQKVGADFRIPAYVDKVRVKASNLMVSFLESSPLAAAPLTIIFETAD
ncbi:hypothetical protein [Paenibacillus sp. HW567]|uniref:hypothetical protein n=1 Tax=Paenibacillus sp. HW567 TaxID=1034769 RepID=UPI0003651128|nr:hypothetical protein [Paenibacillus sp. HW567]